MRECMTEQTARSELAEILRIASQRLREWEQEVERLKGHPHIKSLTGKGFAALLQYNATLKIARLGTELLGRAMVDPKEGLLFGLTKRPMIETYTRGIWLEKVATENNARGLLLRRSKEDAEMQWTTLRTQAKSPTLTGMWDALDNANVVEEAETLLWMRGKEAWWNHAVHVNARSVWMGWSDETEKMVRYDEEIKGDFAALIELAARCARHIHRIIEGVDGSPRVQRIFKEKDHLRTLF